MRGKYNAENTDDETSIGNVGFTLPRREFIAGVAAVAIFANMPLGVMAATQKTVHSPTAGSLSDMTSIKTKDGTDIFYKDWGPKDATRVVFHHGWPLSSDDWDNQMMFFLDKGFRVIAHDRRGHGGSTQSWIGTDMDTYAADVIELADALNLKGAIHVGHTTGGALQFSTNRLDCRLAPWQLRRAKELLYANIDGSMGIASIAHECGLSRAHFSRAFSHSVGVPPYRWLRTLRIERAKDLLRNSSHSLSEIALICGFTDQSHFNRAFRCATGLTPRCWRIN